MALETDAGGGKTLTVDETIDFLKDDDKPDIIDLEEKKPVKAKEDDKEDVEDKKEKKDDEIELKEEDEDDELKEIEEELEGPTEDQLELVVPVRKREILAKFPTLFKEFPYLEKAYYRDQQFTEVFPTVQEAKDAVEKATALDNFENDLLKGNTETIFKAIKEQDQKAFYKIADNYIATLANVDEKAYHHVVGNLAKDIIVGMVNEGRSTKNEALETAAQILNQFIFGKSEYEPPKKLVINSDKEDEVEDKISERELAFIKKQFEASRDDLNVRVNNTLKATIEANIDPRDSMSPYVKKNASREAIEIVTDLIGRDTRFISLLDKLWEKAREDDFNKHSLDRIRSAYLSKAKTLLPSVIKKARNEALKGTGKRVKDDDADDIADDKGRKSASDNKEERRPAKIKSAKDIPAGMSSLEFLQMD